MHTTNLQISRIRVQLGRKYGDYLRHTNSKVGK